MHLTPVGIMSTCEEEARFAWKPMKIDALQVLKNVLKIIL